MREWTSCRYPLSMTAGFWAVCCDFPFRHPRSRERWMQMDGYIHRTVLSLQELAQCPWELGEDAPSGTATGVSPHPTSYPWHLSASHFSRSSTPTWLHSAVLNKLISSVSNHQGHPSSHSPQRRSQRCKDLVTGVLLNIHFCVHNTVKKAVCWISQVKQELYQPGKYPRRFRLKDTWVNVTPWHRPRLGYKTGLILCPHPLKVKIQLLVVHPLLGQPTDHVTESLNHLKISYCRTPRPQRNSQIQTQH